MLVSAAVCPHPPAIVPAVSRGAAGTLDAMREAAIEAVRRLAAARPDAIACVGLGSESRAWGVEAGGSLRGFGVDVAYGGPDRGLPLSLTIAAYLLEEAQTRLPVTYRAMSAAAPPGECARVGEEIAGSRPRVALLVMGDGSAKRSESAPGYADPRAAPFDAAVAEALAAADPAALLAVDPGVARDLWAAGRAAWQVLAGALGHLTDPLRGEILYEGAPLGVGSFVVLLTPKA